MIRFFFQNKYSDNVLEALDQGSSRGIKINEWDKKTMSNSIKPGGQMDTYSFGEGVGLDMTTKIFVGKQEIQEKKQIDREQR